MDVMDCVCVLIKAWREKHPPEWNNDVRHFLNNAVRHMMSSYYQFDTPYTKSKLWERL